MTDYAQLEAQLTEHLRLDHRPVAVAFLETPPAGVPSFAGTVPSSCSFWSHASNGRTFFTVPSDHYNCPIGAYTHNIDLPGERAGELGATLELMAGIGYVRMEEVPGIPRLPKAPGAIVYAPLGETPVDPDVALFIGRPMNVMLLQEAANYAGLSAPSNLLGRPTCMALPATLGAGVVTSTGCIGNRVYTGIDEGELYVAVAGKHLTRLAVAAQAIAAANAQLLEYHSIRREHLTSV